MRRCSVVSAAGADYTGAMRTPWVVVISGPPCSGSRHPGHLDAERSWDPAASARYAPLGIEPGFVFNSDSSLGDGPLLDALAAAGVPVRAHGAWTQVGDTSR